MQYCNDDTLLCLVVHLGACIIVCICGMEKSSKNVSLQHEGE